MVADPVRSVAQQAAPKFGMVAMPENNQVISPIIGEFQNAFSRISRERFAIDVNAMLGGDFRDFLPALLEIIVRRFGFTLRFAR